MKKTVLLVCSAVLALSASVVRADEDHAYTQGPVTTVSFVRTAPGMFDEYLKYLDNTYKKLMDQLKKQGAITEYAIFQAQPRDPGDADVIITVTYKNMAALDTLQSSTDAVVKELFGSLPKAAAASADREKLRKQLGSQTVRQLILK